MERFSSSTFLFFLQLKKNGAVNQKIISQSTDRMYEMSVGRNARYKQNARELNCSFTREICVCIFLCGRRRESVTTQSGSLPGSLSNKAAVWHQRVNGLLEGLTLLLHSFQLSPPPVLFSFSSVHLSVVLLPLRSLTQSHQSPGPLPGPCECV